MILPLWGILAFKWPLSTDLITYATDLRFFSAQFWAGEIYPRWLTNTNDGFGSPVFLFYGPLAFYIMSFFQFLAPVDPYGFGRIFIGMMLAIFVSGITSYRWLRQQLDRETAEKGALLYAGFPYLLLHIYGGFAIAQLWSLAFFALLMESAQDMLTKNWRSVPKMALAYMGLCCTHLPSMLMFAAVPWLYVAVLSGKAQRLKNMLFATIAGVLGVALSMIYIVPALKNKPYIASEHFLDGHLIYSNNFLDTYSLLGMVVVILPLVALFFELSANAKQATITPQVKFWLVIEAGFFFMTLPFSKPIWDIVTPLHYLQFPFRFFMAMLPGTVYVAIRWLPHVKSHAIYRLLFVIGLTCAAIYSEEMFFITNNKVVKPILDNNLLARPEYQTHWMEERDINFSVDMPERFKEMKPVIFASGTGHATIISEGSRTITLHADITSPEATLKLRRFYFPGWVTTPHFPVSENEAMLALTLSRGEHDIIMEIPWFVGEKEGVMISLGGLLILLGFIAFSYLQGPEKGRITDPSG